MDARAPGFESLSVQDACSATVRRKKSQWGGGATLLSVRKIVVTTQDSNRETLEGSLKGVTSLLPGNFSESRSSAGLLIRHGFREKIR